MHMPLRYPPERILIRCPNWIGDAVVATAALRCMRKNYPDAHISLLVSPYVLPALEHAPWFNDVIEYDSKARGIRHVRGVARKLREGQSYDLALLLTHSFSSALVAWLGWARLRVGHARPWRSWLLTDPVPWPGEEQDFDRISKVDLYSSLLEYLGCDGARDQRPEVFTTEVEERRCDQILDQYGRKPDRPLVAIVPGAAYGSSKLWDPERFAVVANELSHRRNTQTVILTGPGERHIGQQIMRHMKGDPIFFGGTEGSFANLKAVIRRSALVICNDTGPRHVAIAYNIPSVVIMGPTDPSVTHSDYKRTIIVRQDVPCAPCYLRTCTTDHQCMKRITPKMVIAAAEELLDRYPPERK